MPPIITLTTDFGTSDPYVAAMKGVVLQIAPNATVVDITHAIPPQAITVGAMALRAAVGTFPPGTIHIGVVDPGVGSSRRPLVIETRRGLLVGPDNGLLSLAARALGIEGVRVIENEAIFRHPVSRTFHGRDIFSPVAAHLTQGLPTAEVGNQVEDLQELEVPEPQSADGAIVGEVVYIDHYGNLISNIPARTLTALGSRARVAIDGAPPCLIVDTYADTGVHTVAALVGSWETLEIVVRNGSAAAVTGGRLGSKVRVSDEKAAT